MKPVLTIEEWLKTNPSLELKLKVIDFIRSETDAENRIELEQRSMELKKVDNLIKSLKDLKMPVPEDVAKESDNLKRRITELNRQIPSKRKKFRGF